MAVVSPAAADIPDVIPKPSASGSATIATVIPAIASRTKFLVSNNFNRGRNQAENPWFLE